MVGVEQDIDALIFDLDGTLWDAAAASSYGWNLALEKLRLAPRVTVDGIRSVSGRPFSQCVQTLLPELHPASGLLLEALESHERIGLETVSGVLYEGVAEDLPRLAEKYRLFIVSNCPGWYLDRFLGFSGFARHLCDYDCHGSSGVTKPEMLDRMRRRFDLGRTVYVGDTQGDREAAEAAGMDFAFVRYGFGSLDAVGNESPGAVLVFDAFADLAEHFLSLSKC